MNPTTFNILVCSRIGIGLRPFANIVVFAKSLLRVSVSRLNGEFVILPKYSGWLVLYKVGIDIFMSFYEIT